jgi:branched-chain amino acid transport system permease protein
MNYVAHILVMISLYALLGLSLNLVVGYAGILSLCHAAFYGLGAYAATLLMINADWNFFAALPVAVLFTGLLSLIIAIPSLRLRGDYFVLATLGFQGIVFAVLYNWVGLTGGPYGIRGIPAPTLFGLEINSVFRHFFFSVAISGMCAGLLWALKSSPFGRALKAAREDEIAAVALGKNVTALKVTAFAIGAAFAAVPGVLYAGYMRYIDPTSFTLAESIFIVSVVVIGGAGSLWGPCGGAVFVVLLPELLRFLQIPDAVAANMRQIIYGLLLIVLMRYRPQGFWGEYAFE